MPDSVQRMGPAGSKGTASNEPTAAALRLAVFLESELARVSPAMRKEYNVRIRRLRRVAGVPDVRDVR